MNLMEITKGYEPKQNETNGADEELAGYYRQVEAACEGAGGVTGASDGRERRVTGEKSEDERVYPEISGKNTQAENGKTEAILRESRNARRNSSFDNRTVRKAEAESIASAEQRRFEEQKRLDEQERARAARRRNKKTFGTRTLNCRYRLINHLCKLLMRHIENKKKQKNNYSH